MLSQPEKATLPVFGVPISKIEELPMEPLKSSLRDIEAKRVESAESEKFYVYPVSKSIYKVESVKKGVIKDTYQVNMNRVSACSCSDFLYNCSPNEISCKHIWRIRILFRLECLPNPDIDPFAWLITELFRDIHWIDNQNIESSKYKSDLDKLINHMTVKGKRDLDYRYLMRQRARTMLDISAATL